MLANGFWHFIQLTVILHQTAPKITCIYSIPLYHFILFIDHEAPQATKNHQDVRLYVRQISVIDNQRTLSQLSHKLEPRRP